jgi:excisionase family DNA binding protein
MRNTLLGHCADGSLSGSAHADIAAATKDALERAGVAGTGAADEPSELPPNAHPALAQVTPEPADHGQLLHAPRAPPWGVLPPAVERLQPIGLSPLQAAAYLGTSRSRIYRLLREGRLRGLKQGVTTIVTLESLKTYVVSLPEATFNRLEESVA